MYLKTLSVITAAYLFLLMAIMMGTAPQTLAFNFDKGSEHPFGAHQFVDCEKPLFQKTSHTHNI